MKKSYKEPNVSVVNLNESKLPPTTSELPESPSNQLQLAINEIVDGINSGDTEVQYIALQMTRKMVTHQHKKAIELMIKHDVVPLCLNFFEITDKPSLQFEAAWSLTNMVACATTEQILHIIDSNAVPKLLNLMASKETHLMLQAIWCLGNLAGAGSFARDMILEHNVIDTILNLINPHIPIICLRNIVWLMANLCRSTNPSPSYDAIKHLIPVFKHFLISKDIEVLSNTCWGLSFLTEDDNFKIQVIIDTGALPFLFALLDMEELKIIVPILKIIGNIAAGTTLQTDQIINAGGLLKLAHLLQHSNCNIVQEVTWILSNMIVGNQTTIKAMNEIGIFYKIYKILDTGNFQSQKEAAWVVANTIVNGSSNQVGDLVEKYLLLKPFINFLDVNHQSTIIIVLNGLTNLFAIADKLGGTEIIRKFIEEAGGLTKLELLKEHKSEEFKNMANKLISSYFSEAAIKKQQENKTKKAT